MTDISFPQPETSNTESLQIYNQSNQSIPLSEADHQTLLKSVEQHENAGFEQVELVYVTPDRIVEINQEYLDRDYVTDIISFRYDEGGSDHSAVEGTLFCCAERIQEQAEEWDTTPKDEFKRIFIHGLLHLLDYEDQSDEERDAMRNRENYYLSQ